MLDEYFRISCHITGKTYSGETLQEAIAARDAGRAAFAKGETPAPTPDPYGNNNANRKYDYKPRPSREPGPHTSARRIIQLSEDTHAGGVMASTIEALEDQLGGNVTAAESLLIQAAAIKATRLFLLGKRLLECGDDEEIKSDDHALAYMNSMRCDLTALGLGRRVKDVTPNLKDIIRKHEEKNTSDTPEDSNVQDAAE